MTNLNYAEQIGSVFAVVRLSYCSDDNTYTEHQETRRAWACPVNRPARKVTLHRRLTPTAHRAPAPPTSRGFLLPP